MAADVFGCLGPRKGEEQKRRIKIWRGGGMSLVNQVGTRARKSPSLLLS